MSKKILITGVAGYIGSIAAYLFLKNGYEVVGIDNFQTGYRQPIELLQRKFDKDHFRFYEIDLREGFASDIKEFNFDAIVHYAASCVVDESMKHPYLYFNNNPRASLNLLETMTKFKVGKIVMSSTCAVYGEAQRIPIDEDHPTNPDNVYGESKLMAERIIRWYGELKGISYIIFRYFNVSGATGDGLFGYSKHPSTHVTENAVKGALGIDPFFLTYKEYDTPDGSPIRDYVNVVDLNEAHLLGVEYLLKGGESEIMNLGTGSGNSVLEIVEKVEAVTGKKLERKKDSSVREGEASKLVASIEKAKRVLGWQPKRSIEDSVTSLINWYKEHPHGWEK